MEIEIKTVKLSEIKLNPDNPRTISKQDMERLVKSLQEFPDMLKLREIVVDEKMVVLGGNMRLLALQKIGVKECTAKIVTGLTKEQKREFVIKDNASMGEWNFEDLANGWSDLPLADWGVDLPKDWLKAEETQDAEPQIDRGEELNKIWKVKAGDLYQIGEHRLLCGDSTKAEDVARVMDGEKAYMVFTDPPYGVAIVSRQATSGVSNSAQRIAKRGGDLENDDLDHDQLLSFLNRAFKSTIEATQPGAAWYVTAPHGLMGLAFSESLAGLGVWRHSLVWVKDSLVLGRADYHYRHEPIYYGWTPGAAHHPVGDRTQDSVWEFPRPKSSVEHPTMKPVDLVSRAIINSSNGDDLIYDPFLGSGTTMVSCENLKRRCFGIEISDNYCAVILQRMTDAFPGIEIRRIE